MFSIYEMKKVRAADLALRSNEFGCFYIIGFFSKTTAPN